MNLQLPDLEPDIAGALSLLDTPDRERAFPIPTQTLSAHRKHQLAKRQDGKLVRAYIQPENAKALLAHLPREEGDRMHAVLAGDFIYGDLLTAIAWETPGLTLAVATLSLSEKNIEAIAEALESGYLARFELILSHYFQSTSRELFAALEERLGKRADCRIVIARTHCKVALFHGAGRVPLVLEGSANLRSSGNLEQVCAIADSELHAFHRGIFDQIFAREVRA